MTAHTRYCGIILVSLSLFSGCAETQNRDDGDERSILRHAGKLFDTAEIIDLHGYYVISGQRVELNKGEATSAEIRKIMLRALKSQERKEVLDSMQVMATEPV